MIFVNTRGWLMMAATAISPLLKATEIHYFLAQRFVIDLFQNFLSDETCIKAFDKFINYGVKRGNTALYVSAYEPSNNLLKYSLSFR